jgi:hypothetical protein
MNKAQEKEKELLTLPRNTSLAEKLKDLTPFAEGDCGGIYFAKLYKFEDNSILGWWDDDGEEGVCSDEHDFDETVAENTEILCKWPKQ